MASRIDSSEKKGGFKKRAHRPWKPALLETIIQNPLETAKLEITKEDSHEEFDRLHHQLETTIAEKAKERNALVHQLALKEEARITIGGFFQPKNIVFSNEADNLHQTSLLLNDLKTKEQEILELTNNLKVVQAEEHAERAEEARKNEVKAREAAEEKAIMALSKAQQAADYGRLAEERALNAEQNVFKLEQSIKQMEEKLKTVEYEHQLTLHTKNTELQTLIENFQKEGNDNTTQSEALKNIVNLVEMDRRRAEERLMVTSEEMVLLTETLNSEKLHSMQLENDFVSLTEKFNQLMIETNQDKTQLQTMNMALKAERALRKVYEDKAKEIAHHITGLEIQREDKEKEIARYIMGLEMQRKAEEQARRNAEEKAKQTIEQAKAVMQLLSVPNS